MANRLTDALLKSAHPAPSVDNLLRAIALSDRDRAAAAWRAFEANADFDNLTWGEFRLIGLAARRLTDLAPDSPMRPRISGIERSIWSRSQLVIGEASSGLRKLNDASLEMLIMKGAGRAASGDAVARGRIVNDIDIVVRPEDLERAFDVLVEDKWTPAASGSPLYHRSRLKAITGINLVRGEFGNIDLHRTPFHAPFDCDDDSPIWRRSAPGKLGYAAVRVPSPLDTIIIAIAHGSLDAHKSSDWLADVAASINEGVDWDTFFEIASRRNLLAASTIALSYVRERLECPVPTGVLVQLETAARRSPLMLVSTVAQARPKTDRFGLFWLARALAKQSRLLRVQRRDRRPNKVKLASFVHRSGKKTPAKQLALEQDLVLPGRGDTDAWKGTVDIEVLAELPPATRRVEFEINTKQRHLLRLRAIVRNRGHRRLSLRFRAKLEIPPGDTDPRLCAVPARSFNTDALQKDLDRYCPTPFAMLAFHARKKDRVHTPDCQ